MSSSLMVNGQRPLPPLNDSAEYVTDATATERNSNFHQDTHAGSDATASESQKAKPQKPPKVTSYSDNVTISRRCDQDHHSLHNPSTDGGELLGNFVADHAERRVQLLYF